MATLKGKFKPSSAAEKEFYKSLRKVAQVAGHIIDHHVTGHMDDVYVGITPIKDVYRMNAELARYAKQIEPWATRQSAKLLKAVSNSNKRAYSMTSKIIGQALKLNIAENNVERIARALMNEQVALIKSIPIEAGQRAQNLAINAVLAGTRAIPDEDTIAEIQKQLGLSTEVATSRALLISITETARANASINEARAVSVGSSQYRWHNSGDEAVRHSHKWYKGKLLQGKVFSWDDPPTLDDGMTGHPGTFPRCRCFAEPVFDE